MRKATKARHRQWRGERLLALLDERGLSRNWLAERIGVSRAVVTLWILNGRRPKPGNEVAIAEALGVERSFFLDCDRSVVATQRSRK